MFSRILIPTDGSPAFASTIPAGIEIARLFQADLTGLFVAPEFQYPLYIEATPPSCLTDQEYRLSMQTVGETYLKEIHRAATAAGVNFSGEVQFSDTVALTIVKWAEENGCDLIFMGAHGRSGRRDSLLGSVTLKVLLVSRLPVLVYPPPQENHLPPAAEATSSFPP